MTVTLDDLVGRVSRRCGQYRRGTATGGTLTTLTDTANLGQKAGHWGNHYVYILSGNNLGVERLVAGFADGVLSFPAMVYEVAPGDQYEVRKFERADVLAAIDYAMGQMGDAWLRVVVDDALSFSPSQQVYDLPANCVVVRKLWIADVLSGGDAPFSWVPIDTFEVTGGVGPVGTKQISMRGWPNDANPDLTYRRKMEYLALADLMTAGEGTTGLGALAERQAVAFIEEMALHWVNQMAFDRDPTAEPARARLSAAERHYQAAQVIRQQARPEQRHTRVRHWEVGGQR